MDLGASGRFQSRVSAKEFCEHLVKMGMPDAIKSIYLYMSDIIDEKYFLVSLIRLGSILKRNIIKK